MKKLLLLIVLFNLSVGVLHAQQANSAGPGTTVDGRAEERKIKYLAGLHKITSDKELHIADSVTAAMGIEEADMIFLSPDYEKMHRFDFHGQLGSGEYEWTADTYVDSGLAIRAKVLRPSTKEELAKSLDELRNLLNTPANRERQKIIDGQIGKPAPLFSVTDVDGVKYDLRELKGKVVVMNFWFIGCAPCKREMPRLNELVQKYKSRNVVFLAFEVNDNSPGKIKAVAHGNFDYTMIASKRGEVDKKYQVGIYPTSYVIDQSGIVQYGIAGYNPFKLPVLDQTIASLLEKTAANK